MIILDPLVFGLLVVGIFFLGCLVGFWLGQYRSMGRPGGSGDKQLDSDAEKKGVDGSTMVLRGSLDLMSSKWGSSGGEFTEGGNGSGSSVVEYLSPEKMAQLLFSKVKNDGSNVSETLRLDEMLGSSKTREGGIGGSTSSSLVSSGATSQSKNDSTEAMQPESFIHLLSLIQKYSVDTSHPYFFNQLFGSLDPIALAAEIVALSVNTSVYTYETAPVFTLLEREVMNQIGKLVFLDQCKEGDSDQFEGEGLMIPGGSLANLTAMHAARHRWKVMNGFNNYSLDKNSMQSESRTALSEDEGFWQREREEEKKFEEQSFNGSENFLPQRRESLGNIESLEPNLVAFVSSEAHYSFAKSARVLGMSDNDLIVIPTLPDGRMDVKALEKSIEKLELELDNQSGAAGSTQRKRVPFFVACTAGSTVRGSFDDVAEIVKVCRDYESRSSNDTSESQTSVCYERTIWVHVDGAWGGSAIFSSRPQVRSATRMDEIRHADSFTFNPHKMLGAPQQTTAFIVRHRNALRNANAAGARYLFDPRKNGAEYDLGDLSYTCGRRTDAVKLWALWKYYGKAGLGARVDQKVDELDLFVQELCQRPSFALACKPWPFNVNFFYFPPRIREVLRARGIESTISCVGDDESDHFVQVPDDIAEDLANVSVTLKLRLHEAGEMIIPYQVRYANRNASYEHVHGICQIDSCTNYATFFTTLFPLYEASKQPKGRLLPSRPSWKEEFWNERYSTRP